MESNEVRTILGITSISLAVLSIVLSLSSPDFKEPTVKSSNQYRVVARNADGLDIIIFEKCSKPVSSNSVLEFKTSGKQIYLAVPIDGYVTVYPE